MRILSFIILTLSMHLSSAVSGELEDAIFWDRFLQDDSSIILTKAPTLSPTLRPTLRPTRAPTQAPTNAPTAAPFPAPTRAPTVSPTPVPTFSPTKAPTLSPTRFPTKSPTPLPTDSPVQSPTDPPLTPSPTVSPTQLRTKSPTRFPTTAPVGTLTPAPTDSSIAVPTVEPTTIEAPTVEPTTIAVPTVEPTPTTTITDSPTVTPTAAIECRLDVNSTCTVRSGFFEGQLCENIDFGFGVCLDQPSSLEFKYTGGGCDNSRNQQQMEGFSSFSCSDTAAPDVPPSGEADSAYIIVTDTVKRGNVYHRDWVRVGDNFVVEGELLDYIRILVFRSEDTGDPANLLQEISLAVSCAEEPLALKDQFGSTVLTSFVNTEQGEVSCIVPVYYAVDISVPSAVGSRVELDTLNLLSNNAGFQDFSDMVQGVFIEPGNSLSLELPGGELDLAFRRRYTSLVQATGVEDGSGDRCEGSDFDSFIAGSELGPRPPTAAPTQTPTSTAMPTANNLQTACSVEAEITCECLSDDDIIVGSCEEIADPSTLSCTNDLAATGLSFKYSGFDGTITDPDVVIVVVASPASGLETTNTVTLGNTFSVQGNFGGSIVVSTYRADSSGSPGELLDETTVNTACSAGSSELTLTSRYGPLELIAFENALGVFSSIVPVRLTYKISNTGPFVMVAESAVLTSDFQPGNVEALPEEKSIDGDATQLVFSETGNVDTFTKFQQNNILEFSMSVTGRGQRSNLACSAETQYSF